MRNLKVIILIIAGARPNFMKIAPLLREFRRQRTRFSVKLIHTGQHYDFKMSDVFFRDLGIPNPDIYLGVGSGSHAVQTAKLMTAFEKVLTQEKPDWIIVVGDVNSTLACSLVASKMGVKVAHVEAGLRSFDRSMPEEVNRIVTDALSDALFVSEPSGVANLKKEGVAASKVFFVGNVMIDTLLYQMPKINKSPILKKLSLKPKKYAVLTLHRPINVDSNESLSEIYDILADISKSINIISPLHPRAKKMLIAHNYLTHFEGLENLKMVDPLGYIDFMKLVKESKFVLTDSGGIQEETTVLKIPCLTMRENTERPITIKEGTNYLVRRDKKKIIGHVERILGGKVKDSKIPKYWDGRTGKRIVRTIIEKLQLC